ncbi:uncharacterized protein B0J16DRAFT_326399 [Fusarium flagelliforme]|uniref:uncharacterized protein n=1 Tax=Fusarium flagelliforme TaxID=2675880 RepID=UPI001E8EDB1A|nr:uncharacterized protein B0J16DRAFT_326399 [Fusarium flagelliforme]KAH7196681.1 hypothetical protein B0J16DRAFT_326399 [Fusarium flagelliforme]
MPWLRGSRLSVPMGWSWSLCCIELGTSYWSDWPNLNAAFRASSLVRPPSALSKEAFCPGLVCAHSHVRLVFYLCCAVEDELDWSHLGC